MRDAIFRTILHKGLHNALRTVLPVLPAVVVWTAVTGCIPDLIDNPARDVRKNLPTSYRPTGATPAVPADHKVGSGGDAATSKAKTPAAPPPSDGQPKATPQSEDAGRTDWRDYFKSTELRALLDTAIDDSQELQLRTQEIFIAQAELWGRRGEYFPRLGAEVRAGGDKVGAFTSRGYSDEATGLPAVLGDFSFGLRASWEVDVWGKLRNAAAAADRRYLASQEARNFMVTQVIAEVARSYYELLALDSEIAVLTSNIEVQTQGIEVVKAEKAAGRVNELAVQRFEAEVLKNRSRLFDLQQDVVIAENRINFLAGRYPQHVPRHTGALQEPLPTELLVGVPTQLLDNRPDVRQAALEVEAAKLDVESARAAFLPAISLDAGVGYRAFDPRHLIATPESLVADLAGNLVAPLLNRPAIEAMYRSANARQIQAVVAYERTLLQGFTDVVNQLARFENLHKAYELQAQQVELLGKSVDVSNVLFQSGRADYMEVLLTRRDVLDAQTELIETKKRLLLTTVDLYEALGGGWRAPVAGRMAVGTVTK